MKLGTFLLLLNNRLFIPTLGLLQSTDKFELRIPKISLGSYGQRMLHILEPHEDWLLRTTHGPKRFKGAWPELKAEPEFLAELWLTQLAERCCVWCWNEATELLDAMWKIYGQRGVAVFSTVGKIRKALELAGARRGIVSRVDYMSQVFNWLKMALPENLHRPYLFKDSSFRIEQEVRFVLLANPIATSDSKGVLINIDAKTIIENSRGFKLSPELPEAERACIVRLASQLLNAAPRSPAADEEPLPTFLQPFFEDPHLPPGIFPDLD